MTQGADSGRIGMLKKGTVMTATELQAVETFSSEGLEVVEFVESWYDSDDLGYFAEYAEEM